MPIIGTLIAIANPMPIVDSHFANVTAILAGDCHSGRVAIFYTVGIMFYWWHSQKTATLCQRGLSQLSQIAAARMPLNPYVQNYIIHNVKGL
jgi:hypothetical protein